MVQTSNPTIPIELMGLLTTINNNVNEVKIQVARIEAQNHTDSIKIVKTDLENERNERIELQVKLATVQTRLSAIVFVIPMIVTAVLNVIIQLVI